jgi:hypothetical protein
MKLSKKVQEIVESITVDREELIESVSGLSQAQLDYKPGDDQWSISDIVHHLALTDEGNAKLIKRMLRRAEQMNLSPDDAPGDSMVERLGAFGEEFRNTKAQAPDFFIPHSSLPVQESFARLKASRRELIGALEQLALYDLSQLTYRHPILGELNLYQWLIMAGRHESRHSAQIKRIKSHLDFPSA